VCVDTQTDPANCGGCAIGGGAKAGHACTADQICVAGVCQDYQPVENVSSECTSCPCSSCAAKTICCTEDGGYGPICLDGTACP
jgi:hypothetical protein